MHNFIYNLTKLNISIKNKLKLIILISCFLLAGLSFLISMANVYKYGGVDLRNKVVGARLFLKGINPYIVPAKPPEDEHFLDPSQRYPGFSRVTVTPPVLLFYGILAKVPYLVQRFIWAIIEWIAIITSLFLLLKSAGSEKVRYYITCFCLVFFCCGYFWLLHIERGQYYIYLAFLLSLAIYLENKYKESIYSGIVLGLLALFRPTYIIFIIYFILFKKAKTVITMGATIIILFAITLFFGGLQNWKSYYERIKADQNAVIDENYTMDAYGPSNQVPEMAEGLNIRRMTYSKTVNVTFLGLSSIYIPKLLHRKVPYYFLTINMAMVLLIIIISILVIIKFKNIIQNNTVVILYCINSVLLIEYFSPERYSYQDVLFMPVVAIIMPIVVYPFSYKWIPISIILAFSIDFIVPSGGLSDLSSLLRPLLFSITVSSILFFYILNKWRKSGMIRADKQTKNSQD